MNFSSLIDQDILVLIPRVSATRYHRVKLTGVEVGGIWIESQAFTTLMLQAMGAQVTPKTPVFFLPYHEIALAISSIDIPGLNEKAFGV
jgi:hypothetical protein